MAHLDELHGERADLDHVLRLHDMELDVADIMLRQLPAYERAGQLRAVNRRGYSRQHIRRRADVILVPVRNQIRAHALPVSLQIGDVGNHKVHTEHIRGKIEPQSTTTMSSPNSKAVMFLPTSPNPPSGIILSFAKCVSSFLSSPFVFLSSKSPLCRSQAFKIRTFLRDNTSSLSSSL